jgi:signal transduction histidine kinase
MKSSPQLPPILSSPWQLTAAAVVFSMLLTMALTALIFGVITWPALLIAAACAGPTSYLVGSVFKRYADTIAAQNAELRSLNAELEAFAQTVAHDLKNPLNTIVVYGDLLKSGQASSEIEERALTSIVQTGRSMAGIIDGLLLLASARDEQVKLSPVETESTAQAALKRLHTLTEAHDPTITLPQAWPTVHGYAPWVEAVFANLLSNAIKYGGEPPTITVTAERKPGGMAYFAIKDDGPGLSEADQAGLFTAFATTEVGRVQGHGLGLSIVKRITERLGGQVGVKSTPGQGATFWFTLPTTGTE